jgi:hypothetical protein
MLSVVCDRLGLTEFSSHTDPERVIIGLRLLERGADPNWTGTNDRNGLYRASWIVPIYKRLFAQNCQGAAKVGATFSSSFLRHGASMESKY